MERERTYVSSFLDKIKSKINKASPDLLARTSELMEKGKKAAVEMADKAAPVIKQASSKASAYAQEKSPVIKAQALRALEEAKVQRAVLQEKARSDKVAHAEFVRTMYLMTLTPRSREFIDEKFNHYGRSLNFMCITGEVLASDKRADVRVSASHSLSTHGGGFLWQGTGSVSMNVTGHSFVNTTTNTAREFWIRLPDGVEKPIYLFDSNIPMREGQVISLIFCNADDSPNGTLVALVNHTAKAMWKVLGPAEINQRYKLYTKEPGVFNGREVRETTARLLNELDIRLSQLGEWAGRFEAPSSEADQALLNN